VADKEIQVPPSQKLNIAESYDPLESVTDKDVFVLHLLYNILTEQTTGFLHMSASNHKLRLTCNYV